jgi:hypothetical protein
VKGSACVRQTKSIAEAVTYAKVCRCYPSCASIKYTIEIHIEDYEWSMFTVFKEEFFIPFVMRRVFGFEDLLVGIGGFMGLILGASFISIGEFFYFLFAPSSSERFDEQEEEEEEEASIWVEYSDGPTVHGLNHVVNKKRPIVERLEA